MRGAVDQGDVARLLGKRLEQAAERGDADPAGQQQDLATGADALVQAAVGAFDRDPGPGPDVPQAPTGVAEVLDGDPQGVAGGRRRQ